MLGTLDEGSDYMILGTTFIEHFYTIYDQENQKIGLAVEKGSTGSMIDDYDIPGSHSHYYAFMTLVLILGLMVIAGIVILKMIKKNKEKELEQKGYVKKSK